VLARQERNASADTPDPASSILKIRGSQLQQAATELMMEIAGPAGMIAESAFGGDIDEASTAMAAYLNFRKVSIYGGSNEIQRNIIAKTILGLQ
jgi:alkylation response protein AidB-like acyl-CoA dehydrogenase